MADKIEVEIVRDYWTGEDERRRAGEVVAFDVDTAMSLVERGIAKTVKRPPPPEPVAAPAPTPAPAKAAKAE